MAQDEIERFVTEWPGNTALRARLAAEGGDFDRSLAIVREAGYAINAEEAVAYLKSISSEARAELSDAQLDAVTGGGGGGMIDRLMNLSFSCAAKFQNLVKTGKFEAP